MTTNSTSTPNFHVTPDVVHILIETLVDIAEINPKIGYRKACAILRQAGWRVNHKRIERLWRELGYNRSRKSK